jgi:hypothetical protein
LLPAAVAQLSDFDDSHQDAGYLVIHRKMAGIDGNRARLKCYFVLCEQLGFVFEHLRRCERLEY